MSLDTSFLHRLFAAGVLIRTGVDGLYGRSGVYEQVFEAVEGLITRLGADAGAEVMRFPPGLGRSVFEQSGYMKGFPHLAGTVHCFCGDESNHRSLLRCMEAGQDWTEGQQASDIVLTPAACYPVYPVLAARGRLPEAGALVDVGSWCFRREPSREPTRQQMFRMREYVRIGTAAQAMAFREEWIERLSGAAGELGLPYAIDVANDPFFGRAGTVLAQSQRAQETKFEILVPINDGAGPTACTSFNYHATHFGQAFGLCLADGAPAHSACIGFGPERLTLALFRHHGMRPTDWPVAVRARLWI